MSVGAKQRQEGADELYAALDQPHAAAGTALEIISARAALAIPRNHRLMLQAVTFIPTASDTRGRVRTRNAPMP